MSEAETPTPLKGEIADSAQAADLCTHCGLCCNGALHVRAVLDAEEIEPARAIGLPLLDGGDQPAFSLPCPKLSGSRCTIFGNRPRVCGRYQCKLLLNFEAGAVTLEVALDTVRTARALTDAAQSALPPGLGFREARAMVLGDMSKPENGSEDFLRLKLAVTLLTLYLDRNFRKEKEGNLLVVEPVDAENSRTKVS